MNLQIYSIICDFLKFKKLMTKDLVYRDLNCIIEEGKEKN
jgi:hypothetical protein